MAVKTPLITLGIPPSYALLDGFIQGIPKEMTFRFILMVRTYTMNFRKEEAH